MDTDIVVVGNGVLGNTVAWEVLRRSAGRVTVVGPRPRPGAATKAAGAMLGCFGEVTKDTLASPSGRARFELALHAAKLWPEWVAELAAAADTDLAVTPGTFVILNAKGGMLDSMNYRAVAAAADEYGVVCEDVNPDAVPGVDATPTARPLQAMYLPDEGSIDARAVLAALDAAVEAAGGCSVDGEVTSIDTAGGQVKGVTLGDGRTIAASRVVVTAGAWSTGLVTAAVPAGQIPPVLAGVGVAAVLRSDEPTGIRSVVRTPNRSGACGLHAVPHDDHLVYVGATNDISLTPDRYGQAGLHRFLLDCAVEQVNRSLYSASIVQWLVGNRPAAIDGFPLLGPVDDVDGLWLVSGTYREGFHGAPVLSRAIVDGLVGTDPVNSPDLTPFAPSRPPLRTWTAAEAIEEWVLHYRSGSFEHDAHLPGFVGSADVEDLIRPRAEQFYLDFGIDFGLLPEIAAMVEFSPHRSERLAWLQSVFADVANVHGRGFDVDEHASVGSPA